MRLRTPGTYLDLRTGEWLTPEAPPGGGNSPRGRRPAKESPELSTPALRDVDRERYCRNQSPMPIRTIQRISHKTVRLRIRGGAPWRSTCPHIATVCQLRLRTSSPPRRIALGREAGNFVDPPIQDGLTIGVIAACASVVVICPTIRLYAQLVPTRTAQV